MCIKLQLQLQLQPRLESGFCYVMRHSKNKNAYLFTSLFVYLFICLFRQDHPRQLRITEHEMAFHDCVQEVTCRALECCFPLNGLM